MFARLRFSLLALPALLLVLGAGNHNAVAAPARQAGLVLPRGQLVARPWMVMIDNHPLAYPQSGLDKAAVVFEALAEGGITRFIATYADGITPAAAAGLFGPLVDRINGIAPGAGYTALFVVAALTFAASAVAVRLEPPRRQERQERSIEVLRSHERKT